MTAGVRVVRKMGGVERWREHRDRFAREDMVALVMLIRREMRGQADGAVDTLFTIRRVLRGAFPEADQVDINGASKGIHDILTHLARRNAHAGE